MADRALILDEEHSNLIRELAEIIGETPEACLVRLLAESRYELAVRESNRHPEEVLRVEGLELLAWRNVDVGNLAPWIWGLYRPTGGGHYRLGDPRESGLALLSRISRASAREEWDRQCPAGYEWHKLVSDEEAFPEKARSRAELAAAGATP